MRSRSPSRREPVEEAAEQLVGVAHAHVVVRLLPPPLRCVGGRDEEPTQMRAASCRACAARRCGGTGRTARVRVAPATPAASAIPVWNAPRPSGGLGPVAVAVEAAIEARLALDEPVLGDGRGRIPVHRQQFRERRDGRRQDGVRHGHAVRARRQGREHRHVRAGGGREGRVHALEDHRTPGELVEPRRGRPGRRRRHRRGPPGACRATAAARSGAGRAPATRTRSVGRAQVPACGAASPAAIRPRSRSRYRPPRQGREIDGVDPAIRGRRPARSGRGCGARRSPQARASSASSSSASNVTGARPAAATSWTAAASESAAPSAIGGSGSSKSASASGQAHTAYATRVPGGCRRRGSSPIAGGRAAATATCGSLRIVDSWRRTPPRAPCRRVALSSRGRSRITRRAAASRGPPSIAYASTSIATGPAPAGSAPSGTRSSPPAADGDPCAQPAGPAWRSSCRPRLARDGAGRESTRVAEPLERCRGPPAHSVQANPAATIPRGAGTGWAIRGHPLPGKRSGADRARAARGNGSASPTS